MAYFSFSCTIFQTFSVFGKFTHKKRCIFFEKDVKSYYPSMKGEKHEALHQKKNHPDLHLIYPHHGPFDGIHQL
jgi:hypothetical protein